MTKQVSQQNTQGKGQFWINFLVMPIGGIITTVILALLIAPIGKALSSVPVVGGIFEQLCRSTNAACNPANLTNNPDSIETTTFVCQEGSDGKPTTVAVVPDKGNVRVIRWVSDYFTKAGFDPQTRCQKVSERFQTLYDRGWLSIPQLNTIQIFMLLIIYEVGY